MSKSLKFSINEKRILIFFLFTLIIWLKLDHKVPPFFLYVHEYKLQNLPFSTFSDYSCAYIGDILLHGSIYISQNWICFYSKIRARGRRVRNSQHINFGLQMKCAILNIKQTSVILVFSVALKLQLECLKTVSFSAKHDHDARWSCSFMVSETNRLSFETNSLLLKNSLKKNHNLKKKEFFK